MSTSKAKGHGLGRGLDSLLGAAPTPSETPQGIHQVSVQHLQPGRYQPRANFDHEDLSSLVLSIRDRGLLQPILVRPIQSTSGQYEIVAGERRWRAAKQAGLANIPVVVKKLTDQEALEAALIENIQRENLSPIEEANGYLRLCEEFKYSHSELAKTIGKSRSHVANTLRLLELPASVQALVDQRKISPGHARALITSEDPEKFANYIMAKGLNVRQTEALVKSGKLHSAEDPKHVSTDLGNVTKLSHPFPKFRGDKISDAENEDWEHVTRMLQTSLGLPVEFCKKQNQLCLVIELTSMEKFDQLLAKLTQSSHEREVA